MKIYYFTTAMSETSYREFSSQWNIALNPSNQNFHNKLIRSLAVNNDVEVISIRPYSKRNCNISRLAYEEETFGNVTWHYLAISQNKFLKLTKCLKQAKYIIKKTYKKNALFISDTINPTVIAIANKMKEKFKAPLIGVCTDNPDNITGVTHTYSSFIYGQTEKLDGYISLTKELNLLFNKEKAPKLIIEGVVENELPIRGENLYGKYVFFGGAMMEKYGVYNLIEAFKLIHSIDTKLILCGHHCNEALLKSCTEQNHNIIYLGNLPVRSVLELEQNALVNVNPRPYSETFDKYSIPSKTIEYLSSGIPTISVTNSKLMKYFKNEVMWVEQSTPELLAQAIRKVMNMTKQERLDFGILAKNKVKEVFSINAISSKLDDYLSQFINEN